jgi:hypothetical protein
MTTTRVSAAPPSDQVQQLLDLIPDRIGFIFVGLPDQPSLRPESLYTWSPDEPAIVRSPHSDLTYPNDQYPEDKSLTVTNRLGQTVEYPYYEDADGKRYFMSAHVWYKARDYVLGSLTDVAADDPLGAARLLYRFYQVYQGWVPTNEYPWFNRPVEPASTPPGYYWGGMWYRWSIADFSGLRHVTDAFKIVDTTNAFGVLSDEVGEDVRELIVGKMLEPSVDFYRSFPILYTNMDFYNALGLVSLGEALNAPKYIHEAAEWALGFVEHTYLFDGFYQETTLSYHVQSTNGLIQVLEGLKGWTDPEGYLSPRSGQRYDDLDLAGDVPVVNSALEIPGQLIYPNGHYFPLDDTWAFSPSGAPDWTTGSLLLPASGVARLSRGALRQHDGYFGILLGFLDMTIVSESVDHKDFAASATVQLEANDAGEQITFSFTVDTADKYEIDLQPFRAGSYGRYQVLIDGAAVKEVDFYATASGPADFLPLATLDLAAGSHQIAFVNVGKDDASTNYKMGVVTLALLDAAARQERDAAGGDGPVNPSQAYLTFTPKYGHHHYAPLNLALWAEGQELLPDIGYTHTFYRRWTQSALAHNTVVVDSADMVTSGPAKDGGDVGVFADTGSGVAVVRVDQKDAYPQTSLYSREAWSVAFGGGADNGGYVLDLFRVAGGSRHEYALQGDANHDATFTTDATLATYGDYLLPAGVQVRQPTTELDTGDAQGHYYGYIYVRDVQRAEVPDGHYALTLATTVDGAAGSGATITGLVEAESTELFIGQSPSVRATRVSGTAQDTNDEAVKYFMPKAVIRREGSDLASTFITAIEPHAAGAAPRISAVERLEVEGAIAVKVTWGDTTDLFLSALGDSEVSADGVTLNGRLGFVRRVGDTVSEMVLIGGTSLTADGAAVTADGPATGTITATRRKAAGDGEDAFVTDTPVSADFAGRTMVVTHSDGKTNGYKIKSTSVEDGKGIVVLDGTDPGFSIGSDGNSALVFYPFTQWSGAPSFRVDNVDRPNPSQ